MQISFKRTYSQELLIVDANERIRALHILRPPEMRAFPFKLHHIAIFHTFFATVTLTTLSFAVLLHTLTQ